MDKHSVAVNGCRVKVLSPNGRVASPYRVEGNVLIKRVQAQHIYRLRQAIGVDENIWQEHRDRVDVVRFEFPESVREISAEDFERKSFLHGDDITFARTRFVRLADLRLVREAPPARRQLALALG